MSQPLKASEASAWPVYMSQKGTTVALGHHIYYLEGFSTEAWQILKNGVWSGLTLAALSEICRAGAIKISRITQPSQSLGFLYGTLHMQHLLVSFYYAFGHNSSAYESPWRKLSLLLEILRINRSVAWATELGLAALTEAGRPWQTVSGEQFKLVKVIPSDDIATSFLIRAFSPVDKNEGGFYQLTRLRNVDDSGYRRSKTASFSELAMVMSEFQVGRVYLYPGQSHGENTLTATARFGEEQKLVSMQIKGDFGSAGERAWLLHHLSPDSSQDEYRQESYNFALAPDVIARLAQTLRQTLRITTQTGWRHGTPTKEEVDHFLGRIWEYTGAQCKGMVMARPVLSGGQSDGDEQLYQQDALAVYVNRNSHQLKILTDNRQPKISQHYIPEVVSHLFTFEASSLIKDKVYGAVTGYFHKDPEINREDCSICLDSFSGEEGTWTLVQPCQHTFHLGCLLDAVQESVKCPLCRTPVEPVSTLFKSAWPFKR